MTLPISRKYLLATVTILFLSIVVYTSMKSVTGSNVTGSIITSSESSVFSEGILPAEWPDDMPTPPMASLQLTNSSEGSDGKQHIVLVYSATDTAELMTKYYARELPSRGWTMSKPMTAGSSTVITATKDTRSVSILIVDSNITLELVL